MVERTAGFAPDVETPEQKLQRLGRAIYQQEQIIKSAKPGTSRFNKAKAAREKLQAEFDEVNAEVNAARTEAKTKKKTSRVNKAREEYEREIALGKPPTPRYGKDGTSLVPGTEAYFEGSTSLPKEVTTPSPKPITGVYTGSGTTDKPLTLDGKNFTGTYKGKTYKDGILTVETPKPKGDAVVEDTGGTVKDKTLWISYLRTVFAELEDKDQRAQINLLFKQARQENWDEKKFMDALEGTTWWQTTFPSLRQFFLESNDPRNAATFAEKTKNNIDSITAKIEALGISPRSVDPNTGRIIDNTDFIKGIALKVMQNNWTDDQLENYLSTRGDLLFTGGGTIGSYYDRISQTAYLYGMTLDDNMKKAINTSLLDPLDGRDAQYWLNSVKQMAYDAPQNKPFAESLKAGRSLYEVTSSYRNQMANLLEVDSTAITWDDLMGKVLDKETGNARTFADFTKALKQDPLWQYTRNAKETYDNMALDLAKMFGFAG